MTTIAPAISSNSPNPPPVLKFGLYEIAKSKLSTKNAMTAPKIYLDYAATTPVDKEVLTAMLPSFSEEFGNPESLHSMGLQAKQAVDKARNTIAKYLNCRPSEIIFTSGGTESNNLAIIGAAKANGQKGNHLITSAIEHPSVLNTFKFLAKEGFEITWLAPDREGFINPERLEKAITPKTILVSIMFANNEIGTVEPIRKSAEICKKHGVIFHTDACQAAEYFDLDMQKLKPDLLTVNGSKIYGPKGIGFLYIGSGTKISPLTSGGDQEYTLRPGTHNVPGIVGLAKAFEIAQKNHKEEANRTAKLRDYFITNILKKIPKAHLNGPSKNRLPNNINISIPKTDGKDLLLKLDQHGICVSTGSACGGGKNGISHVLKAIGLKEEIAGGSLRLSLGKYTTQKELDFVLEIFQKLTK